MALLADKSADVNSNLVTGQNSQTLTFTMPGGVAMKVLSVVATVNNGAATAVTPELTIKDQSGVVIAARKQSSTIPAGDTGTATWALRLDDDSVSSGTGGGIDFDTSPQAGNWLLVETNDRNAATDNHGMKLDAGPFGAEITNGTTVIAEYFDSDIEMHVTDGAGKTADFRMLPLSGIDESVNDTFGDGSVAFASTSWDAECIQSGTGSTSGIHLGANQGTHIDHCAGGSFNVRNESRNVFHVHDHGSNDASIRIALGTVATLPASLVGDMMVRLGTGGVFEIQDHSGNPIFRVDEDGDLHGLTGKSLTFDL